MNKLIEWRDGGFENLIISTGAKIPWMPVKVLVSQPFVDPPKGVTLVDMLEAYEMTLAGSPSSAFNDANPLVEHIWKFGSMGDFSPVGEPEILEWAWDPKKVGSGEYLEILFRANFGVEGLACLNSKVYDIGTPLSIPKFQYACTQLRRKEPVPLLSVASGFGLTDYRTYLGQFFHFWWDSKSNTGLFTDEDRLDLTQEGLELQNRLKGLGADKWREFVKNTVSRARTEEFVRAAISGQVPKIGGQHND